MRTGLRPAVALAACVACATVWACGGGGGGNGSGNETGAPADEEVAEGEEEPGDDQGEEPGEDPGIPQPDDFTPPPDDGNPPDPGEDPVDPPDPGEDPATPPPDPGKDPAKDPNPTDPGKDTKPADVAGGTTPVGGPCSAAADCVGGGKASCVPEKFSDGTAGFPGGYCIILDCSDTAPCPGGSECYQSEDADGNKFTLCLEVCDAPSDCRPEYTCETFGACWPGCTSDQDCPDGQLCGDDGLCADAPCTENSCGQGYKCVNGQCVADVVGGPGPGPGPACPNLPPKDCSGTGAYCAELVLFEPFDGDGYTNYPLNGECNPCTGGKKCDGNWNCSATGKLPDQYRSYLRRDAMMLVKWAAAYVECTPTDWAGGNGHPIGLGDMSEQNGGIPGASIGEPGHPQGTHTMGYDIDVAYFQNTGANNYLRPICNHYVGNKEAYHCTSAPNILDVWRTALFMGALLTSSKTRVIGCDGKVGPLIEAAMPTLCAGGWLPQNACTKMPSQLAFEETDTGLGWYYFHHHHLHLSTKGSGRDATLAAQCITPDCKGTHAGPPIPTWNLRGLLPRAKPIRGALFH
ncbi:MAG: hypothetical protein FJ087_01320 [Deltaproteobacteria bacterium]|nr:hypothetical protein [Deltaproteobacteria bacterium]